MSVRSWRSSSLCTLSPGRPWRPSSLSPGRPWRPSFLSLFFLAADTDARPRNRLQPCFRDGVAAVTADAEGALLDAAQCLLDRLQNLRVRLFELQLNVNFVGSARLIRHVTLAARVVLHRPLQRLGGRATEQLAALPHQRVAVNLHVHGWCSSPPA